MLGIKGVEQQKLECRKTEPQKNGKEKLIIKRKEN